jgi:D-lyxose ketol-isomerase
LSRSLSDSRVDKTRGGKLESNDPNGYGLTFTEEVPTMLMKQQQQQARRQASEMIGRAGIHVTDQEAEGIEVVDFGLSRLEKEGVQVLTLVQTERISVKVLALFPNQTEPEHWHPPVAGDPGKEETVRVISGTLYFYIPGENTFKEGFLVKGKEHCYTMRHEIVMRPGDQITLAPGVKHWFQARDEGVVMYSFSTIARDALDQFTDKDIVRITKIIE